MITATGIMRSRSAGVTFHFLRAIRRLDSRRLRASRQSPSDGIREIVRQRRTATHNHHDNACPPHRFSSSWVAASYHRFSPFRHSHSATGSLGNCLGVSHCLQIVACIRRDFTDRPSGSFGSSPPPSCQRQHAGEYRLVIAANRALLRCSVRRGFSIWK